MCALPGNTDKARWHPDCIIGDDPWLQGSQNLFECIVGKATLGLEERCSLSPKAVGYSSVLGTVVSNGGSHASSQRNAVMGETLGELLTGSK